MSSVTSTNRESWADRGIQYARQHGWEILPLKVNNASSPSFSENSIERKLGAAILGEVEDASAEPDVIGEMQTAFPVALIGARTGRESNLIAIEVLLRDETSVLNDVHECAPDAPRVLGPNREYVLFEYPEETSLPVHTEIDGAILHGEGSVIRLPWHYYKWGIQNEKNLRAPPDGVLSLFRGESRSNERGDPGEKGSASRSCESRKSPVEDSTDVQSIPGSVSVGQPSPSKKTSSGAIVRAG